MKKNILGVTILASAIIWGFVIVGCSLKLKGTACYEDINVILFAGVLSHILIFGAIAGHLKKGIKKGSGPGS
jgi:hypothetical protein